MASRECVLGRDEAAHDRTVGAGVQGVGASSAIPAGPPVPQPTAGAVDARVAAPVVSQGWATALTGLGADLS